MHDQSETAKGLKDENHKSGAAKSKITLHELLLLAVVILVPWPLGMVQPGFELLLALSVALIAILWVLWIWCGSARNQLRLRIHPVLVCLAGMILLGCLQIIPLPAGLLSSISPGTQSLYSSLLPAQQEQIDGQTISNSPAGMTLSLYPDGTRREVVRLMGIAILFFVIVNGIASTASAKRLCWAMLANGVLLGLFAIVQQLTSDGHTVFWAYPTPGNVFGPFVNRNHYAMLANACLGMGIGLALHYAMSKHKLGQATANANTYKRQSYFDKPIVLWIAFGCSILIASSLLSMSRGGLIALLAGAAGAGVLLVARSQGALRGGLVIVPVIVAAGIVSMIGWDDFSHRVSTLVNNDHTETGRLEFWARAVHPISQFPVFGTGMGTFQHVESGLMHATSDAGKLYIHAHNDYLQTLIEGGILWLGITLALLAFVMRDVSSLCARQVRSATAGIGIGLVFAVLSLIVHGSFDFGLHIPSIMLTATVIIAYVSGISIDIRRVRRGKPNDEAPTGFIGKLVVSSAILVLCFAMVRESNVASTADLAIQSADRLAAKGNLRSNNHRLEILSEAAAIAPENAPLRLSLAQAHLDHIRLADEDTAEVLSKRSHLVPAMKHAVAARNACPTIALTHVRIASHLGVFSEAQTRQVYLDRGKSLCPVDPMLWYLCGSEELKYSQDDAWRSWSICLGLSPEYLDPILERCITEITPTEILERVLPSHGPTIIHAANRIDLPAEVRTEFLNRAIAAIDEAETYSGQEHFAIARTQFELGNLNLASKNYRKAVSKEPTQIQWRYELATLYYNEQQMNDARRELHFILGRDPGHAGASELMDLIQQQVMLTSTSN